jgi:uncharacterized membrane protein
LRRRVTRETVAVAAAVAGVAVSIYLTILHYVGVVPACPVTGHINCEVVLSSAYGVIAGTTVPTSAAGIVWFAISAVLWLRPFGWMQLAWSAIGLLTVLYLVFVEIVQLGAICLWCTAAHALVLIIFLIALMEWSSRREAEA